MKFRSRSDYNHSISSPAGSRYRNKYQKVSSSEGSYRLERCGVEDVYDSIQKAALGNTISDLIGRAKRGDVSAIPPPVDSYADVSHAPKDLLEAHGMLQAAKLKFSSLPADIRAKVGNSFETFLNAMDNGTLPTILASNAVSSVKSDIGGSSEV